MTECPTPDQLQLLLDAALPGTAQASVENHIDGCPACQQSLERLTAGPVRTERATVDPAAETFIARVRALAPGADIGPRPERGPEPGCLPDVPGYEVESEIGRGGMGVVYRARHKRLNRLVALKMLTEVGVNDPSMRTRFLVEAETVAQLRHPHVVQVYEFGDHAGRPYLALEYVDGGNLAERLAAGRPFGPVRAAEVVACVADGVAAAHAKGIIHRDLKPSNILLVAPDPAAGPSAAVVPKVADFGIARVGRSEMTATGEVLGTPNYMAPEQAAGRTRDVGTATDVYGLGAILYELLAGRPPFDHESVVETLVRVVHDTPRSLRAVSRSVPRDLDTICLKCLEKEPKKRYPTADALAADLRAFLGGRAISARPAPVWELVARFVKRNPVPALALFLVIVTSAGAFVGVDNARREQIHARVQEKKARDQAERNEADAIAARLLAERGAARTAFDQADSLSNTGDVERGLAEFARGRGLAQRAGDAELDAVIQRSMIAWEAHRPREVRRFDTPDPARPVTATTFADDGRLLVTGSRRGGPVRVWPLDGALPDGRRVWELAAPDAARPGVIGLFAPHGTVLYAVYESGHIGEWDLRTGEPGRVDRAFDPASPIRSAKMTVANREGSGRLIAAGHADGTARIWDLNRHALLTDSDNSPIVRHFFQGPKKKQTGGDPLPGAHDLGPGAVTGVDFGDTGNMLLTAGEKEGVILLGLRQPSTGKLLEPIRDGKPEEGVPYHQFDFGGPVTELLVGPGRQLFLAGGASAVSMWTIHDRERPMWVHGHPDRVTALAFSSGGALCASADRGGTVCCWSVRSGAFLAQLHLPTPVCALRFLPGAPNTLLVGGQDGSSALWRLSFQGELAVRSVEPAPSGPGVVIRIGSNPEQAVHAVGFDPIRGGEWTATPRKLVLWSSNGAPHAAAKPNDNETITPQGTAISANGKWAVVAIPGRDTISICDLAAKQITPRRVPARGVTRVGPLNEKSFFTVAEEFEPETKRAIGRFAWWELGGEAGATRRAAWPLEGAACVVPHPDAKSVLVARTGDDRVAFRDLATGREVGSAFKHAGVTVMAIDPGANWAATAGQDRSVRVWALSGPDAGRPVERSPLHGDRVNAIAFGTGPSAGVLVTASSDGTARFWDAKTGYPLGPPLRHAEAVLSVAFDSTGERVITGERNGEAKIWPAPKPVAP